MRIVQISFFLDPQGRPPQQLLQDWRSLVDVAEAVAGAGAQVFVIQACVRAEVISRRGVTYHFIAPDKYGDSIAQAPAFRTLLGEFQPDVLHVHGLGFPADVVALAQLAPDIPIILQDHASHPPRFWRRRLWRRGLAVAQAVAFCSHEQALPFTDAGLIDQQTRIFAIPESSSHFTPGDRSKARILAGIAGDPCVLWVGHLNANKDPLAVLDGISAAARELPGLQMWCCFGVAPLFDQVKTRIECDPLLRDRVHLMGQVPHATVEQLMRAADVLVTGSHREGSGYSLIEALAVGLPAVVTDIPSFRALTADGTIGHLWPCGDAAALCRGLLTIAPRLGPQLRNSVREHFEREVSFPAVGKKLVAAYTELVEARYPPAAAQAHS